MDPRIGRWRKGDFEAFLELARPHLEVVRAFVAYSGLAPAANKRKWIEEHGEKAMLWMKGATPAEAMDALLESRVLNLEKPAKSPILTKPTLQEEHGSGGSRTSRRSSRAGTGARRTCRRTS